MAREYILSAQQVGYLSAKQCGLLVFLDDINAARRPRHGGTTWRRTLASCAAKIEAWLALPRLEEEQMTSLILVLAFDKVSCCGRNAGSENVWRLSLVRINLWKDLLNCLRILIPLRVPLYLRKNLCKVLEQ
jgi:hypothetical protein